MGEKVMVEDVEYGENEATPISPQPKNEGAMDRVFASIKADFTGVSQFSIQKSS